MIIGLLAVLLSAPFLAASMATSSEPTNRDSYVVTGILAELDLVKLNGTITTDLRKTISFTMKNPNLFNGISVGERLAVVLDHRGQAVKVMGTSVPDRHPTVSDLYSA